MCGVVLKSDVRLMTIVSSFVQLGYYWVARNEMPRKKPRKRCVNQGPGAVSKISA